MSDTENKGPKWHLKTREPVQGMDLECVTYCKSCKCSNPYFVIKEDIPLQPARKKRTKSKPR